MRFYLTVFHISSAQKSPNLFTRCSRKNLRILVLIFLFKLMMLYVVYVFIACLCMVNSYLSISRPIRSKFMRIAMEIPEYGDDESNSTDDGKTDEDKGLSHGYEGDFKIGDKVRVTANVKIWSVKQFMKEGFEVSGFTGTVSSLALYGRKHKTLCSAITPIRVEFQPDGEGIPTGMFDKKFILHFASDELERI